MKRFGNSDSLVPFLYPQEGNMQMMMDGLEDEESMEEIGHGSVKKRRLAVEQVQSLEKIFEVDNKLDPERKTKLAQELGLQPRQVAIWFQNRRARWKTKQLERDYNHLKSDYENLRHSFSAIEQEKQNLVTELNGLKEKLEGKKGSDQEKCDSLIFPGISGKPKIATNSLAINEVPELKDGSSDESDTSSNGFLKVQNNPSPKILSDISCSEANPGMCLSSSMYYPQFLDSRPLPSAEEHHHHHYQQQHQEEQLQLQQQQHNAKMEVVSMFGVDESCNILSVDQSQNSHYWYYYDQRI